MKKKEVIPDMCLSINGQHFKFWNLTYDGMLYIFERNINWFLEYVRKERSEIKRKLD